MKGGVEQALAPGTLPATLCGIGEYKVAAEQSPSAPATLAPLEIAGFDAQLEDLVADGNPI